jgi:hypothetical protein
VIYQTSNSDLKNHIILGGLKESMSPPYNITRGFELTNLPVYCIKKHWKSNCHFFPVCFDSLILDISFNRLQTPKHQHITLGKLKNNSYAWIGCNWFSCWHDLRTRYEHNDIQFLIWPLNPTQTQYKIRRPIRVEEFNPFN